MASRPGAHTARRLRTEAARAGHHLRVVDPRVLGVQFDRDGLRVAGLDRLPRATWLRPGPLAGAHGLAVLEALEARGVVSLNPAGALALLSPPARALLSLHAAGIAVVPSAAMTRVGPWRAALRSIPAARRLLRADGPRGLVELPLPAGSPGRAAADVLARARAGFLLQDARAPRTRVLVIDGEVPGALEDSGGEPRAVVPGISQRRLALRAARVLGLRVAGVDLCGRGSGCAVLAVTGSPALEALEVLGGRNLAALVIRAWVTPVGARGGRGVTNRVRKAQRSEP